MFKYLISYISLREKTFVAGKGNFGYLCKRCGSKLESLPPLSLDSFSSVMPCLVEIQRWAKSFWDSSSKALQKKKTGGGSQGGERKSRGSGDAQNRSDREPPEFVDLLGLTQDSCLCV